MQKGVQFELGFTAVAGTPAGKKVVRGRPRRLSVAFVKLNKKQWLEAAKKIEDGQDKEEVFESYQIRPSIIKIAIKPDHISQLERISRRLEGGSTQPDMVRMVVDDYIDRNKQLIETGEQLVSEPQKRTVVKKRCIYVKVPFSKEAVEAINKLCFIFNATRQQIVNKAIEEFLQTI